MKYLLSLLLIFNIQASTTGTLFLSGNVPKKVEISVTPDSVASTLDLEATQVDLTIAELSGKSNVNAGYKISLASSNNMKLVNVSNPLMFVNYSLKIGTTSITNGGNINYTGKGTFSKDLKISYTGIDFTNYDDGNYNDTLTFTIVGN
jgi:hypothetical protein